MHRELRRHPLLYPDKKEGIIGARIKGNIYEALEMDWYFTTILNACKSKGLYFPTWRK